MSAVVPLELIDTHCHIHFADYGLDPEEVIMSARQEGVTRLLCVGCTLDDSKRGVAFAQQHTNIWASIGLHPHEAKEYVTDHVALQQFHALAAQPKVVAIGECGLDYYYHHSPKADQKQVLRFQLDMAVAYNLPVIFHIREAAKQQDASASSQAFADFWHIFDDYEGLRGVVHSFSAGRAELDQLLARGLYVGLNGIMTFTGQAEQLVVAQAVPLDRLLIETDAPFLTPTPYRGTINQPKYVGVTAKFLADLRGEPLERFATATTQNAVQLFGLES